MDWFNHQLDVSFFKWKFFSLPACLGWFTKGLLAIIVAKDLELGALVVIGKIPSQYIKYGHKL